MSAEDRPRCALCGAAVTPDTPSVAVSGGGVAHIACADAAAGAAPLRCARCGHLLRDTDATRTTDAGQVTHAVCPAPPRVPPRRQPQGLAHTSLPRRRRRQ